ncbi:HD domain-containing phosphohydrolase [Paraburkholderia sp. SARCC-3016]|uniref:HD domain-containing phosphohydrolase n=1 Tax=Paraburkholderia sp. SARCC-3016 TaxID=3058611 RepID=UPI00280817BA|nr:HD domain-containing phosphohydrolase [Paraburkholderia sp. SARCC-3016]MDQ7981091.1 HD domain-containing phosphohydrolase [Paraburkholderia sp. SARCC-3016]
MNASSTAPDPGAALRVFDAVKALAFIGDLSMGQPTDHSLRTAWLAAQFARAAGADDAVHGAVIEASLLRWSGCTANASGFADLLGDDVGGREAMLENRPDWAQPLAAQGGVSAALTPLAQIHCEVSGEVARMLGLAAGTQAALRHIFEAWDGCGLPDKLAGEAVPVAVYLIALAGDLEIFARVYGVEQALQLIAQRANARYPAALAALGDAHGRQWLGMLDALEPARIDDALATPHMSDMTTAELIADVIDLKLPWMTGYSRAVAQTAAQCCAQLSTDPLAQQRVYRAGLLHGIGRAAVPNALWDTPGRLPASAWERVRLVPYWTARAGRQTGALADAAELASYAYERGDGSGYFRGLARDALPLEARVLAVSVAWVALRAARPWRAAYGVDEAAKLLREDAAGGRFDPQVVEVLLACECGADAPRAAASAQQRRAASAAARLSARETDVLRSISRGASNKEVARELDLSPSTVRTHVESVFRKLECSTRAAATLKASALGLL